MPIVGGYYAYKYLIPADELLRLQIAWGAKQQARKEQEDKEYENARTR